MKKKILVTIIIAILALTLTACGLIPKDGDTYDELNEMLKADYQGVNFEVQTTMNGVTLVNKFKSTIGANNTIVSYEIQELATIDQVCDEDIYVIPGSMIINKTGTAVIKNGVIVEQNGDAVEIPVNSLEKISLSFKQDYFKNGKGYSDGTLVFEGDVTNPKAFTGNQNFDGTDMHVTVRYNDKIEAIVIDYTSANGAAVKIIYTFR